MEGFGFILKEGNGSRAKFIHERNSIVIAFHKPHPSNILKKYVVNRLIETLKMHELI